MIQRKLCTLKDADLEYTKPQFCVQESLVRVWSNCVSSRFFTYGDLPLEQHLKQIDEEALCKFGHIDPNTQVPAQPRWSNPVGFQHCLCEVALCRWRVLMQLPWMFSGREKIMWPAALTLWLQTSQSRTRCVWASCWESKTTSLHWPPFFVGPHHSLIIGLFWRSITDTFENFTLSLLSSLMISGPNAPFYKALIEPKIGTDFSSVVGCVHSRTSMFTLQQLGELPL